MALVAKGNADNVFSAVDNMMAGFAGEPNLIETVQKIAKRCEFRRRYELAKGIQQKLTANFSGTAVGQKAALEAAKGNVLSLVKSRKYSEAEQAGQF